MIKSSDWKGRNTLLELKYQPSNLVNAAVTNKEPYSLQNIADIEYSHELAYIPSQDFGKSHVGRILYKSQHMFYADYDKKLSKGLIIMVNAFNNSTYN